MTVSTSQSGTNQSEQKRGVLISQLSVIVFIVTLIYMILDWILNIHVQYFIYISFLSCSILTFVLNQLHQTGAAKIVALSFFNILIFLVASSEPFETGLHLHFFSAGVVAVVIYGFEEWKKGIGFVALSLCLYLTVFLYDIDLITYRAFTHEQSRLFFVINMTVAAIMSTYSFMLFSKINYNIEQSLRLNQEIMKAQNEKLEKANMELDRFVYSASHDLRAPLSSLSGLITLTSMTTDIQEIREYHTHMQNRILVMDKFIKEIIDYSRNSRVEVLYEKVNLKNLIDEVIDTLKFSKDTTKITVHNKIDESFAILSDEYRLKVIFSNLISNAFKYHNISKSQPYIVISSNKNDRCIKVEDNGIGISREHQTKIFEMFYRAHENSEGSGLGLYIVKETMARLGGTVEVESEPGKGSVFIVKLSENGLPTLA